MTPKLIKTLIVVVVFTTDISLAAENSLPNKSETNNLMEILSQQGVQTGQILDVDANGIPRVCGISDTDTRAENLSHKQAITTKLPPETRGWEVTPGVIRNNGVDTFRLEVDTNGSVSRVTINSPNSRLISSDLPPFELRDDGLEGDRIAGDFVFTSGQFRYNTSSPVPFPDFYGVFNDPSSPAGLTVLDLGQVLIEETGWSTSASTHYMLCFFQSKP